MSGDLQVKPIKDPSKLEVRQSPTPHLPRLPTRALVLANSGGGGTTLLVNLLTRKSLYGDAFSSIFVWSQSVNIDSTWAPLKEQCRKRGQKVEEHFFSEWNGGKDIEDVIDTQERIVRYHKEHKHHKSHSIACVVDDFGDQGQVQHVSGGGGVLNRLAIRGRHYCISFFIKSQRPVLLSSTLRTQCSAIYCFAQRSQKDLDIFLTELSALVPRRILERIYRKATERKYNFLMVDLLADSPDKMFFWNLDKQIVWRNKSEQ